MLNSAYIDGVRRERGGEMLWFGSLAGDGACLFLLFLAFWDILRFSLLFFSLFFSLRRSAPFGFAFLLTSYLSGHHGCGKFAPSCAISYVVGVGAQGGGVGM